MGDEKSCGNFDIHSRSLLKGGGIQRHAAAAIILAGKGWRGVVAECLSSAARSVLRLPACWRASSVGGIAVGEL